MTTQSTLTDLQSGDAGTEIEVEESDTTNNTTEDAGFKETLKDIGISRPARTKLTEEYDSVDDLTSSSDVEIQSINGVGEATIETIRQELDENVGEDYKITDSGEGYCKAEWTEKADEDEDILTGEILLRDFVSDEFGHQATI
jgi:ERCC4-type nuclease